MTDVELELVRLLAPQHVLCVNATWAAVKDRRPFCYWPNEMNRLMPQTGAYAGG